MPIVNALRNDKLRDRHWIKIKNIMNKPELDIDAVTLGLLIKYEVDKYSEEILLQSTIATNEFLLEESLKKI